MKTFSGFTRVVGSLLGMGITFALVMSGAPATARTVYPGDGVVVYLGGGMGDLSGTSTSFRRFVHRELVGLWKSAGKDPACRSAAEIVVGEYRRRVAFFSDEGVFADHAPRRCARGGGWQFAVRRHGRWTAPAALGGQDVPACKTLRSYHLPRMTGALKCYEGDKVRNYTP